VTPLGRIRWIGTSSRLRLVSVVPHSSAVRIDGAREEDGRVTTQPQVAERLLLARVVQAGDWHVELPSAVAIPAGSEYWIDGATLFIRNADGRLAQVEGDPYWYCGRGRR